MITNENLMVEKKKLVYYVSLYKKASETGHALRVSFNSSAAASVLKYTKCQLLSPLVVVFHHFGLLDTSVTFTQCLAEIK